jgi:hypothetical protein
MLKYVVLFFTTSKIVEAGIATGCGLDDRDVKLFLFSIAPRPTLGPTQYPVQWVTK